ncbi:ester cyclase [Winogradskyella vincentii]|uniref:Ester cyclase n=1 Tax=Winogradskyella vincentii TaxID=2877122 RepID=A0ABS7XZI2_9FLAO|nr:ester cyclase [Winogradskyella vincentii]MCA0153063.1 ester cyclase [Winogradskyella vincentii]
MVTIINKKFVEEYWEAISGKAKTPELSNIYVSDPELLGHIAFFEAAFPKYELFADDYICEDDKVVVRARFKGVHKGELMGIPPTNKTVEFPFTIIYQITDEKISKSWLFADMMEIKNQIRINPSLN